MKIQLIRNATLKIEYAGTTILLDPMLSAKGAFESFAGIQKNPISELPVTVEEVLEGIDLVLVTHTHEDHFDEVAKERLPKDIPLFCQPPDLAKMKKFGFTKAEEIESEIVWKEITITRTGGKHGSGEIVKHMGAVSGFVLQAEGEPTLYIIGDSIWVDEVEQTITNYSPQVIVTNSGGAFIPGHEKNLILMNEADTMQVLKKAGEAQVIAVHMEALDHCTVTRASLKKIYALENLKLGTLHLPLDGEMLEF
ncbi:MBL fold metallo-hydrolase [Aquimarina sp. 2-A2]|uniref:MBL fold metallo-hydrolase n=1 Tax=Aquimarina sp. 2-A2 TaxID=3382644 RepID=UPI00387EF27D